MRDDQWRWKTKGYGKGWEDRGKIIDGINKCSAGLVHVGRLNIFGSNWTIEKNCDWMRKDWNWNGRFEETMSIRNEK